MAYLGFHSTHFDSTDDNFDKSLCSYISSCNISMFYCATGGLYVDMPKQNAEQSGFNCVSYVSYTNFDNRKKHAHQLNFIQCNTRHIRELKSLTLKPHKTSR